MAHVGSQVRWIPHGRMPADPMTKVDPAKGNLALADLLRRGTLVLIDEEGHLDERALNISLKTRSRKACQKVVQETNERIGGEGSELSEDVASLEGTP